MDVLARKWRRFREAACVSAHGVSLGDRLTLLACYFRLLVRPPGETERVVDLRIDAVVHAFAFRERDIFTFGEILFEHQYSLPETLADGATIVSAGANIGVMARLLQARYPAARLIAFEPAPGNAALLRRNVGDLPNVTVEECALSDTTGTALLHLGAHDAEHSLVAGEGGTPVRCERLDDYLDRHGIARVALLKVDVEGSEAALVRGLGRRLDDIDVIIGEFHEALVSEDEFYPRLEAAGFTLAPRTRPLDGGPVHLFRADRRAAGATSDMLAPR